ncbi:MAG: PAS domain-containing protein [Pseudomonadota bacterium]
MDGDSSSNEGFVQLNAYRRAKSDEMIHRELRALHHYWETLRAGRATPMRSDIDPRDMACDARNLFILENLGRGNIRFRLAGTAIVDAFGMELRGMNARSIMSPSARESFSVLVSETLEDPGVGYARLHDADFPEDIWEVVLLPLRSDFGMIDRVIGCLHPIDASTRKNSESLLRFRIDKMSVETIKVTVEDTDIPTPVEAFAEPPAPFEHADPKLSSQVHRLSAIDGGLSRRATELDENRGERSRAHLRVVKD